MANNRLTVNAVVSVVVLSGGVAIGFLVVTTSCSYRVAKMHTIIRQSTARVVAPLPHSRSYSLEVREEEATRTGTPVRALS